MKLLSKLKIPFIKSASNGDFDKKDETSQNGGEDSKGRFRDSKLALVKRLKLLKLELL
ncbi:hypothetical protein [Enterobacter cloacae complex sp. 288G10]|uniref:hypothetical protein n=1 Tax=Enterobacter cloacae complex sp. 288G10 TaxID=3395859 RepID=UPI003CF75EDB